MLFRVILAPDDIRRLHLEILPARVEELMIILQQELGLEGLLVVQFEDPAFGNELCNLTNMSDLPEERATLKVFQKQTSEPSFDSQISDTSLDIASLPSALSGSSTPVCDRPWPDPFIVPKFSSDVELRLKHGNDAYHKDGSLLSDVSKDVPKELKSDILDKLAEDMYAFKTHPTSAECGLVAKSLIDKYPCLMERGSSCGWYGWKYRLVFKMGNFRQKLRIAGSLELSVNSKQPASGKKRKRQKARKSEIVTEFRRIVSVDLKKTFFDRLDEYVPRFLWLYRARDNPVKELQVLLQSLDEDPTDEEDEMLKGMEIGILVVTEENPGNLLPKEIIDVALVLEEEIVLHDLKDVPNAFAFLIGLLYALNIDYPKDLKYAFELCPKVKAASFEGRI
ncbi:unnamed protein product [Leuciscus chuanchicus]